MSCLHLCAWKYFIYSFLIIIEDWFIDFLVSLYLISSTHIWFIGSIVLYDWWKKPKVNDFIWWFQSLKRNAKLVLWLGFWSTVITLSCIKNQKYKKKPLYVCEICKVYHDKYFADSRGFTVHLGHNTIQWS